MQADFRQVDKVVEASPKRGCDCPPWAIVEILPVP